MPYYKRQFWGYNKKEVDAALVCLHKSAEKLRNELKSMENENRQLHYQIEGLEEQISVMRKIIKMKYSRGRK